VSSIAEALAEILQRVERPGDFCVSGTTEIFAPRLEVDGVGPIALPLLRFQAEQLVAIAERAPYGRGEETLVDTRVRRTWQIDVDKLHIEGRSWARTLDDIVARCAAGLGVTDPVSAELYKLLLYDEGSFFVDHRDTEKAPGMFATLVVVLPSIGTGGELVVRHRDRAVRLDLHSAEPSEAAFAAFYADCVHEVLPVTSGCRLTLVYNLLRTGKGPRPKPPSYNAEQGRITKLLRRWAAGNALSQDDSPEKLIYPLEHAYTPAEIGFDALKGADAAVAGVLVAAAQQADCDLHLALVSIEESGTAEHTGYYDGRGRWASEDEFEVDEVYDRVLEVSQWRRPDGSRPDLGALPFEDEELCPPGAFDDAEPDEEEFYEATGNEGASFERSYRRASLVLWPRARFLAVLNQAGLSVTLPYLDELAQRWTESGEGQESPVWHDAHTLSAHILAHWPGRDSHPARPDEGSRAADMLTSLARLKDTTRIDDFLTGISANGNYDGVENEALTTAAGLLPARRAADLLERIIARNTSRAPSGCTNLLARFTAAHARARLLPAAKALVDVLPGNPAQADTADRWQRVAPLEPGLIVDLLTALGRLGAEAQAEQAADHLLAWPQTYAMDGLLLLALVQLTEDAATRDLLSVQRLRGACLDHLRRRIGEPLEAPRDWARPCTIACTCSHCSELARFLAGPDRQTWILKAAEMTRRHVEESIRRGACDLDCKTERRGRPYSLECTKNQATYERRARQREKDLANQARLQAVSG